MNKGFLANLITFSRIVFIPFLIIGELQEKYVQSLIIILLISMSDIIDGMVAKQAGNNCKGGDIFDVVADFMVVLSIFVLWYCCFSLQRTLTRHLRLKTHPMNPSEDDLLPRTPKCDVCIKRRSGIPQRRRHVLAIHFGETRRRKWGSCGDWKLPWKVNCCIGYGAQRR